MSIPSQAPRAVAAERSPRLGSGAQRLLTGLIGAPLALLAVFYLPAFWFLVALLFFFVWGAIEYVALLRVSAPRGPLWLVPGLLPPVAAASWWTLGPGVQLPAEAWLLAAGLGATVGLGTLVLFLRTPEDEVLVSLGGIAFGVPYFALPAAALGVLQALDPWLLFLLLAIVWLGDTAAYYVGSRIGRHKMAPSVSPKKSWEGAAASFLVGIVSAAAWSVWRLEELSLVLLAVAAATAVAAQLGDLVESLIKRAVRVKDSGRVLPGHGGMLDRMDALLFAAPVFLAGLWLAGIGGFAP